MIEEIAQDPDVAKGTLKTYYTWSNCLKDYLQYINRKDLLCEEVDTQVAKKFVLYLKKEKQHSQNYAGKVLLILKRTLQKAVELQIIAGSPLAYFNVKKEAPKPIIALDQDELHRLKLR